MSISERIVEETYTERITISSGANGLQSDVVFQLPTAYSNVVGIAAYKVSSADADFQLGIDTNGNRRIVDLVTFSDWESSSSIPRSQRYRRPHGYKTSESSGKQKAKIVIDTALSADLVIDIVFQLSDTDNACQH